MKRSFFIFLIVCLFSFELLAKESPAKEGKLKAQAQQAVTAYVKQKGLDPKWLTAHYHGPRKKDNFHFFVYHDHDDKTKQLHVVIFDDGKISVKLHTVKS